MNKNILVIAGTSDIAFETILSLLDLGYCVFATSRKSFAIEHKNLKTCKLDVCDENSFLKLKSDLCNTKFNSILYCAGLAITCPIELLDECELKKQFDVNLYGLLKTIKAFSSSLIEGGKLINLSSMSSYGLYPYLSPYCMSKAASDIMLRAWANEEIKKYVSIRPAAIKTKFWEESIKNNEANFSKFEGKYEKIGKYLIKNAEKNSLYALHPNVVSKVIVDAILSKDPACTINVGKSAFFTAILSKFFPEKIANFLIKTSLEKKSK